MADEATPQATDVAPAETTAPDSATDQQTTDSNQSSTDEQVENQGKADQAKPAASDTKPSETQGDKQEPKPLSRRSAKFRIQELVDKNKDLQDLLNQRNQVDDDGVGEHRIDDQPNVAEIVQQEVKKQVDPIISESSRAADDAEINELFTGQTADREKYEGKIRSLWNLPQYKDVAASDLLNMIRGSQMDQLISQAKQAAVEEYKKAQLEANESSARGNSNSNRTDKTNDLSNLSDEELLKRNERVKAGQKV